MAKKFCAVLIKSEYVLGNLGGIIAYMLGCAMICSTTSVCMYMEKHILCECLRIIISGKSVHKHNNIIIFVMATVMVSPWIYPA